MTHEHDTDGMARAGSTAHATDGQTSDAFAAAFDAEPSHVAEPYVRLVPPPSEEMPVDGRSHPGTSDIHSQRRLFDPDDIGRPEYRLLERALTNDDHVTDHLAPMTLVQLVKFLRAAGVSVPDFPATSGVPDPGLTRESVPSTEAVSDAGSSAVATATAGLPVR